MTTELVVIVDDEGNPVGTQPKHLVHTGDTPLHLAFSCYVLSLDGELLITRRALHKLTWPGVWTNSACGHLQPGERAIDALKRRVPHEIGVDPARLHDIDVVLPDFRYYATDSRGIVENELCPVFIARIDTKEINPATTEVDSFFWAAPQAVYAAVDATPSVFSPWMVKQLGQEKLRRALG
ncbi:isopentenyl-diphosphate Delta-isomerase [Corynebacterium kutscheri]|uniref:Isopentenyl-diphosphate Delta-isomerase n=1 Tax=Corynebacterium kutscheri TaxID=35755 RepID=A0A0F6TD48_9CORY|nr:isopentenyl-diphosphate Delta-isomerase [Corynebacterium kutscheri]AKE40934.1 isopentenyl-diphosphate delta-isomerase [Corynebacterium kutscheri]VEH06757.1 isopentenyl-diphosphate delta-isomerase [Corynebacterium kutscheri]VEH09233.1 isopentenyl-diphosphate delta-isomerase [Corynebacterium kutscheri]